MKIRKKPSIFDSIEKERKRQDDKWGLQNHDPDKWLMILGEEVGEANKAALEAHFCSKPLNRYRRELIQIAAVTVAMIECLDRQFEGGE